MPPGGLSMTAGRITSICTAVCDMGRLDPLQYTVCIDRSNDGGRILTFFVIS